MTSAVAPSVPYYLATGFPQAQLAKTIINHLASHGYEMTYDWTVHHPDNQGRPTTSPSDIAQRELDGVARGRFLICLLPGGKGTHVELGAAIAMGKQVLVIGRDLDLYPQGDPAYASRDGIHPSECICPTYHLPNVWRFSLPDGIAIDALPDTILRYLQGFHLAVREMYGATHEAAIVPGRHDIVPFTHPVHLVLVDGSRWPIAPSDTVDMADDGTITVNGVSVGIAPAREVGKA